MGDDDEGVSCPVRGDQDGDLVVFVSRLDEPTDIDVAYRCGLDGSSKDFDTQCGGFAATMSESDVEDGRSQARLGTLQLTFDLVGGLP